MDAYKVWVYKIERHVINFSNDSSYHDALSVGHRAMEGQAMEVVKNMKKHYDDDVSDYSYRNNKYNNINNNRSHYYTNIHCRIMLWIKNGK